MSADCPVIRTMFTCRDATRRERRVVTRHRLCVRDGNTCSKTYRVVCEVRIAVVCGRAERGGGSSVRIGWVVVCSCLINSCAFKYVIMGEKKKKEEDN